MVGFDRTYFNRFCVADIGISGFSRCKYRGIDRFCLFVFRCLFGVLVFWDENRSPGGVGDGVGGMCTDVVCFAGSNLEKIESGK